MKRSLVTFILAGVLTISAVIAPVSCTQNREELTIGVTPAPGSVTIFIAEEKGFFNRNGLDVTVRSFDSGVPAVDSVVKGEVALTTSGEFPLVGRAFQKQNINIVAVVAKAYTWYVVGRKDRGIGNVNDLKGKKIAIQRQSLGEFYLGRLLDLHNIKTADVKLVTTTPAQWVDTISEGSVDAVVLFDTYINPVKTRLGGNAAIFSAQENAPAFATISGETDWVTRHPETVKKVLNSLAQAEEYLMGHQAEAREILQRRLNYDIAYLDTNWTNYNFSLSLDLPLIVAMNDEARWMIINNLTTEKTAPDFYNYIYSDGLKAVRPQAVSIGR